MSTPSTPENTSTREPLLHLAGMSDGSSRYIEEMEAAGQRAVVTSSVLPTDAPWEQLQALGFTRGEQVPGDALFTRCELPEGWRREGSDHAMHSYVLDGRGVRRVSIFYKAAFYDRKASASVVTVGVDLSIEAIYGDEPPALPDPWEVLSEAERADFRDDLRAYAAKAERHPDIYGEHLPRAQRLLELVNAVTTEAGTR